MPIASHQIVLAPEGCDTTPHDPAARDETTIERLFDEDPRAEPAARWTAARAAAVLGEAVTLNPLIDLLLDKVISEPRFDIETRTVGGIFSIRPLAVKRRHDLADYESFEDLMSLPTGATGGRDIEHAVDYFWDLAAREVRSLIVEVLETEARKGMDEAPEPLASYLNELAGLGALEQFAGSAVRDLVVAEGVDEVGLVEKISALSFSIALRGRRPDQTPRLAQRRGRAGRDSPEHRLRLKLPRLVHSVIDGFIGRADSARGPDVALLAELVAYVRNADGIDEVYASDDLGPLRLIGLLARDERILSLLPKRGRMLLQRNAARWLYEVERGERDFTHPLVALYDHLETSLGAGASPCVVSIRQGNTASEFDTSNWPFFLAYALAPGDRSLDDTFEIVISRTVSQTLSHAGRAIEISAGVLVDGYRVIYLTAEQFRQGHGAHVKPRAASAVVKLIDAEDLIFTGM